ncbi:MAG TPA: UDP-N-acetylmuramate dehydrogenase [Syntrophomonadaceae bacterium]|nr:UDP-N-acetylmuramate dehydrogenase [Syntrophomonadaceae bacterium]
MKWQELANQLRQKIDGQVLANAPMKQHTTWRVGGPADLLVIPQTVKDVHETLLFTKHHRLPLMAIGNGSNLLVLDGGIRGVVLKLSGGLKSQYLDGNFLVAEGGAMLPSLARMALNNSLSGLEFAVGIPATLGGAIVMNAGAFGQDIGSLISQVEVIDFEGKQQVLSRDELTFGYRKSSLQDKNMIILRATLQLKAGKKEDIAASMEAKLSLRNNMQPLEYPTAGSVFRNPVGDYAGRLIEAVGLKGHSIGDAEISTKHANFIINRGNATGGEILTLIRTIQERVFEREGVMLVPEVLIVGEEG